MVRVTLFGLIALAVVAGSLAQYPDLGSYQQGCQYSPGTRPPECTGLGSQWDDDEIECQLADGYQLKCDYDTDLIGDNEVKCELDQGIFASEIDFDCPVDTSTCTIDCDWEEVKGKVPGSTWEAVYRILNYWQASE